MSVRASKVYAGPIHIYENVNEYDDNGYNRICIAEVDGVRDEYTGGIIIQRSDLLEIYKQLCTYFKKEGL